MDKTKRRTRADVIKKIKEFGNIHARAEAAALKVLDNQHSRLLTSLQPGADGSLMCEWRSINTRNNWFSLEFLKSGQTKLKGEIPGAGYVEMEY
jgi:hypothetical protein